MAKPKNWVSYEVSQHKAQTKLQSFRQHGEMQNKKMDINEVAPVKPLFEGAEKTEKKDVLDTKLIVEAYSELDGDDGNQFGVILFTHDGVKKTTSISGMLLDRIVEASQKIGLDADKTTAKEKYLSDTIEVTIVEKESTKNKNRTYFDFA